MYLGGKLCCLYVLVLVCVYIYFIYYFHFKDSFTFFLCLLSRSCYLQIKFKEFFKRKKIRFEKKMNLCKIMAKKATTRKKRWKSTLINSLFSCWLFQGCNTKYNWQQKFVRMALYFYNIQSKSLTPKISMRTNKLVKWMSFCFFFFYFLLDSSFLIWLLLVVVAKKVQKSIGKIPVSYCWS